MKVEFGMGKPERRKSLKAESEWPSADRGWRFEVGGKKNSKLIAIDRRRLRIEVEVEKSVAAILKHPTPEAYRLKPLT